MLPVVSSCYGTVCEGAGAAGRAESGWLCCVGKGSRVTTRNDAEQIKQLPTFALLAVLKIAFVALHPERVVATMPVEPIHHQP